MFIFGSLALLFFLLGIGYATGSSEITEIAGYEGIIVGASAVYTAAALVLNRRSSALCYPCSRSGKGPIGPSRRMKRYREGEGADEMSDTEDDITKGGINGQDKHLTAGEETLPSTKCGNMLDYEKAFREFNWASMDKEFDWYNGGVYNVAHESLDRHAQNWRKNKIALYSINADNGVKKFTFGEMSKLTSQLASGLSKLGASKGDCIFVYLDRTVRALYIDARRDKTGRHSWAAVLSTRSRGCQGQSARLRRALHDNLPVPVPAHKPGAQRAERSEEYHNGRWGEGHRCT